MVAIPRMQAMKSDETDPFARLESTHRRLEERLRDLAMAVTDLLDPHRRTEALEVIRETAGFFDRGAVRHTDDEDQTLFPRLVGSGELEAVLTRLREEHEQHRAIEGRLRGLIEGWPSSGPDAGGQSKLADLSAQLASVYREHIRREETELFPVARRILSPEVIAEMGREMIERRPDRGRGGGGGGSGHGDRGQGRST